MILVYLATKMERLSGRLREVVAYKNGLLANEAQVPRHLEATTDGCLLLKTFSVYTFSLFPWNTTFI